MRKNVERETLACGCVIFRKRGPTGTVIGEARVFVRCKEGHDKPV